MTKLRISGSLALPLDFVTQTQAILAIKRAGKSYTASVQAEELLKAGQQIVAIDVTGAWWGLRSNATGDGPGFPVVIFGGDHGDVALEETAGEVLAESIVSERFSAIIDLSLFRKAAAQRFLAVFFEALYRRNREAMHLFMDEADFYAPQKPFGEEARTLGAVNDIVRRGGIRGIGSTLITQRPAVLNKDVLTQAGIVTALRVSHPKDMKAILEWVDVHASREDAAEMLRTLPSLPKGDAWVWAPGWPSEKGIFERIHIRPRETFDSGATPKAGHTAKQPKVVAEIDLKKLGEQIAASVQRQKENDPTELKRQLAQVKQELAKAQKAQIAPAADSETLATSKKLAAQVQMLKGALAEAMKIIAEINTLGFNASVNPEELKTAVEAASAQILKLAEAGLATRQCGLDKLKRDASRLLTKLKAVVDDDTINLQVNVRRNEPFTVAAATPAAGPTRPHTYTAVEAAPAGLMTKQRRAVGTSDGAFSAGARKLLAAMLAYPDGLTRSQAKALCGFAERTLVNYVSELNVSGAITKDGRLLRIPEERQNELRAMVDSMKPPTNTEEVLELWKPRLSGGAVKLLDVLMRAAGEPVDRESVREATGFAERTLTNYVSELSVAGFLLKPGQGMLAANKQTLFLEAN